VPPQKGLRLYWQEKKGNVSPASIMRQSCLDAELENSFEHGFKGKGNHQFFRKEGWPRPWGGGAIAPNMGGRKSFPPLESPLEGLADIEKRGWRLCCKEKKAQLRQKGPIAS